MISPSDWCNTCLFFGDFLNFFFFFFFFLNLVFCSDDEAEKRRRSSNVAVPSVPHAKMSNAEISALLQSVIKMSTSNKITQNNCWSLQLTENLTEILGGSGSTNTFQTAASAIDASVKIFAMRVDSVHQETFKLQSGLNRTEVGDDSDGAGQAGNAHVDGANAEGERPLVKTPKRKPGRLVSTLVKNESDLDVAGFDMQYEEDPLVKKASSAFDTGGAKGLLLNQLSVYDGVTLVFDSGDAPEDAGVKVAVEDTALVVETGSELRDQFATLLAKIGSAELCPEVQSFKTSGTAARRDDFLQAQLEKMQPANVFPVHQFSSQVPPTQQVLSSQAPAQQQHQQVSSQASQSHHEDDGAVAPMEMDEVMPSQAVPEHAPSQSQSVPATLMEEEVHDFGGAAAFEYGGGDDDDLDDAPRDFDADGNIISSPAAAVAGVSKAASVQVVAASSSTNQNMIVENNGQISDEMVRVLVAGMDETGYYKAKPTNWTGPEHWNFKGPRAMKQAAESSGANDDDDHAGGAADGASAAAGAKAKAPARKKKADAQYFIDFSAPAKVDWDTAFAPPKRGNTKLTKSTKDKAKSMSTVLPADVHYGPNVLMSLFTKPKWMIPKQILSWKPIVDPAAQGQVPISGEDLMVAREQDAVQAESATAWFNNNENVENPQNQDHYDDDYDNGAYDGGDLGDDLQMHGEQQQLQDQQLDQQRLLASSRKSAFGAGGPIVFEVGGIQRDFLVAEPQRVEQIQLSYAKVARAVDVKTLKASIWRALAPSDRRNSAAAAAGPPPPPESFQALLDDLPARIPKFEQSNVTIPFCFISLLHLANEKGLELQSNGLDHLAIIQH